ncbi:efflux RND transporter permease subunit [Aestuariimicrobium ganziense]|uniref:efflux RND transporter permease subunit n=1 Tax=Aestuariimicrobium ganziense TaxID=2773677 RepID=UPI001942A89F|nr:efflux RND transporter permease subunit [Aestuariimicrobium ganziense]
MHRLADLSLANRALIALITVFVLVFGVVTTGRLKQELIPSVEFPQVFIVSSYPGAGPEVMEEKVTVPIEQAMLTLQGVESTSSTSVSGTSSIVVTMRYGSNMSIVQQDARAAISRIESFLPEGVDTQVITGGFDSIPVLALSVSDESSPIELAQRLRTVVVPRLERIEGVSAVQVTGAPERQVQIKLDKLPASVPAALVRQAVTGSGTLVAAGRLDDGDQTLNVTVGQRYTSLDQLRQLRITVPAADATQPPQSLTLGQVATITEGEGALTSYSRTDGRNSLTLAVTKVPDANTVAVSDAVKELLPELEAELGNQARFTPVFDQAPFISQSIHDLLVEGGMGLVMAVLVILVFLLSIRSTLVTAISIPVSVLMTMIGLDIADYTLNILTLGALTIAIGRVVDDSIVVIENIKRHLSYGESTVRAILTAVREVATAITSATITTVAVFLPIGLVGGQTGELFRPFALTVTLALLSSLLVSLTIVPVLAYWLLPQGRPTGDREEVERVAHEKERNSWLQRAYVPTVEWTLRHPVITLVVAVAILATTLALAPRLKTNFLGDAGQDTLTVSQEYPSALSLTEQDARAAKVEKALIGVEGVKTVLVTVGSDGTPFGFGGRADTATFSLSLDEDAAAADVQTRVRTAIAPFSEDGDLTVSAAALQGSSDVEVIIKAADRQRLTEANDAVVKALGEVTTGTDLTSSLTDERPQVTVVTDPARAAARGLTDAAVQQAVRGALSPTTLGRYEQADGGSIDVVLVPVDRPAGLEALSGLMIQSPSGPVALRDVARVERTNVATVIARTDGQRSVTVSITPVSDNLGQVTSDVNEALAGVTLPEGATAEVGGISREQADAFRQLGLALLIAIAIVYVVMVATFKSLVQPLILAVSIPFAATGALAALLITDTPLGVPSLIGVLMLIGIVVTNAIVLIDLVNHYRAQGQSVDDALINGARQRLRPILMTAIATIFALVPMALGLSGGGVFISKPLAIVVIGGLLSSTLLTLVLVPVLYHLVEARQERRRIAQGRDPVTGHRLEEVQADDEPAETDDQATTGDLPDAAQADEPPARPARRSLEE